jgi:hypothetical protein
MAINFKSIKEVANGMVEHACCMAHLFSLGEGRWSVGICFSPFCNNTPLLRDLWIVSISKSAILTHATYLRMKCRLI